MILLQAYTFLYTHIHIHTRMHMYTAVKTDISREKTPSVFYGCSAHLLVAVGSSTLI